MHAQKNALLNILAKTFGCLRGQFSGRGFPRVSLSGGGLFFCYALLSLRFGFILNSHFFLSRCIFRVGVSFFSCFRFSFARCPFAERGRLGGKLPLARDDALLSRVICGTKRHQGKPEEHHSGQRHQPKGATALCPLLSLQLSPSAWEI